MDGQEIPAELIEEINSSQASVEKEKTLGFICSRAFASTDQMEAQGITPEVKQAAKDELYEMGYDVELAQKLADNGFSPGQIAGRLRFRPSGMENSTEEV